MDQMTRRQRVPGRADPKAATASSSIPYHLRVEALELAVATLSDQVMDLEVRLPGDRDAAMTVASKKQGPQESRAPSEINIFQDSRPEDFEGRVADLEDRLDALTAVHIRASVMQRGTQLYPGSTLDPGAAVAGLAVQIDADSVVRLTFPQQTLSDGRVVMKSVYVDPETMVLVHGWIVVFNTNTHERMVKGFVV